MAIERQDPSTSIARIERGLYAFRYLDSACVPNPVAEVRVVEGAAEIADAPGREPGRLDGPGQVLVVAAHGEAAIEIRVTPGRVGAGSEASFNLDLLDQGAVAVGRGGTGLPSPRAAEEVRLRLAAHVSRRGDVEVDGGEWVAGPDDVLPVEGLAITTDRRDVSVSVRVQSMRGGARWSRWHGDGEFAGSRQRADPLTSIGFALHGDGAASYVIDAEVMSLGAQARRKVGREVEFEGVDPVVGFRLTVKAATRTSSPEVAPSAARLRIFRAKR